MVMAKKVTAVVVMLLITLGMVIGVSLTAVQVSAAEAAATSSAVSAETEDANSDPEETEEAEAATEEEIPLAEAKASVLKEETQEKGMPSIIGFLLVIAVAAVTGIAVALRSRFGRSRRCYQPGEDLTIFKLK